MRGALIFIVLLIIWNSSASSGNTAASPLQFLPGCRAVIHCQHYSGGSDSFKWVYKKDEHTDQIQIFIQDKTGVPRHDVSHPRRRVTANRSLVIDSLTEDDQGLYWCENCHQARCRSEQSTVVSVQKEIHQTLYISAGSSFTRACPGEFTNLKWTFEASNMTVVRKLVLTPEADFVTSNKSIHIVNVQRADAGKYTCWTSSCDRQKLLTVNLCVITVHYNKDSSVSCDVMCDEGFTNPNNTMDEYGSLNCSTQQMFDGYTTVGSTHVPSNAFNKITGVPTEPEYLTAAIYGAPVALVCLIVMALLIFYLRSSLSAAFPVHLCCCGSHSRVEEESSVVYSSVAIRTPAKTRTITHMTDNACVYSEIKV